MTKAQAVKEFREVVAKELYESNADYWTAQLAWSTYTDGLCKDGLITQKQYDTWETPFPYGKPLSYRKVYRRK